MLGVCSWSLQPSSCTDLVQKVQACGLASVQLALDPLRRGEWDVRETRDELARSGITVLSGMMAMQGEDYTSLQSIRRTGGIRPDETWEQNLCAARQVAQLARDLDLRLVTLHAGFLPPQKDDPLRTRMIQRLGVLADTFAEQGLALGLETGQETAETLLAVLAVLDRSSVGVNFDPANMILYGCGDPVSALRQLGPHVLQLHIKDARPAGVPGEWGEEVPVGSGAVDWSALCAVLREQDLTCDLLIEREAGAERVRDVRRALDCLQDLAAAEA